MQSDDIGPKLLELCRRAEIEPNEFKNMFLARFSVDPRTVEKWLNSNGTKSMTDSHAGYVVAFWSADEYRRKGIHLEKADLCRSFDSWIDVMADRSAVPAATALPLREKWLELVGNYQLIRPYSANQNFIVLEALRIEQHGDKLVNVGYSHNFESDRSMYHGEVELGERYYMSLMKRPGKDSPALRSITFYVGDDRYPPCISGLMLRGMTGGDGYEKHGVALPFLAIKTEGMRPFDTVDMVPLPRPRAHSSPLHRVHNDDNIIIGRITAKSYPVAFNWITEIVNSESIARPARPHRLTLHTIPSDMLREREIDASSWQTIAESLASTNGQTRDGGKA